LVGQSSTDMRSHGFMRRHRECINNSVGSKSTVGARALS
jgi:hypothetical protein